MNWMTAAQLSASRHPTIEGLRARANWHRQEGANFLVHSVCAMRQHEQEAHDLEATASFLEMEMLAKAGLTNGEWIAYAVGHSLEVGRYIQVQTDQGWNPDYFWCEAPMLLTGKCAAAR